jgi:hypothetical protein
MDKISNSHQSYHHDRLSGVFHLDASSEGVLVISVNILGYDYTVYDSRALYYLQAL